MLRRQGWLLAVMAGCAASLLAAGWWWLGGLATATTLDVTALFATTDAPLAGAPATATDIAAPRADPGIESPLPGEPEPPRQPIADLTGVHVRGRCVDGAGVAVASASVHLEGGGRARVTGTTTADGTFALRAEPSPRIEVKLGASSAEHLETLIELGSMAPGTVRDVGDVTLVGGVLVSGRVVDSAGQPVAQLTVYTMPAGEDWRVHPRCASAVTGTNGRFTLQPLLAAGRWLVRADPRDFTTPAVFTLGAGPGRHELTLTLADRRQPATISGRVVDTAGHGVIGIDVAVQGSEHVTPATSDHTGSFRVVGWNLEGEATLELSAGDRVETAPAPVAWGRKDVQLVWHAHPGAEVVVRRADTGTPVVGAQVMLFVRTDDGSVFCPQAARASTDASGTARLRVTTPGSHRVHVQHSDFAPHEHPAVLGVGERPARIEVLVSPMFERTLTVTSRSGRPLANAHVALWAAAAAPAPEPAAPPWQRAARGWSFGTFHSRHGTQLAAATTGPRGGCGIKVPSAVVCRLRIAHGDHRTLVREGVVLSALADPWVEVLEAGAIVEGRLDLGKLSVSGFLHLQNCDAADVIHPEQIGRQILQKDGSFRLCGVPAGSWRLQLGNLHLADVFDLRDDETRRIEVDTGRLQAAEIHGTVRWNGRPLAGHFVLVDTGAGTPPDTSPARSFGAAGPQGSFDTRVQAGRYRAAISHSVGGHGLLPFPEEMVLAPRSRTHWNLELRTRAVRVRLLRNGIPVVGTQVRAVACERFDLVFNPTDDHGCAEFALPLGTHPVFAEPRRPALPRIALGNVDVIAGDGPHIVVLNMP